METPKSVRKPRLTRNPTPKLSERKKSLFLDRTSKEAGNDMMEGIKLLEPSGVNIEDKSSMPRSRRSIEGLLDSNSSSAISFLNDLPIDVKSLETTSSLRRSPRNKGIKMSQSCLLKSVSDKENSTNSIAAEYADEQLQKMFKTSMRITSRNPRSSKSAAPERSETQKRHLEDINETTGLSPHKKTLKYTLNNNAINSISPKKFYSGSRQANSNSEIQKNSSGFWKNISTQTAINKSISPRSRNRIEKRKTGTVNINKGVKHKIRRPTKPNLSGGRNYSSTLSTVEIDQILKNVRNENLKNRIALKREERLNIEKIHNIFRSCKNPIEMARPLTALSGIDDANNNTSDFILPLSNNNDEVGKMIDDIDTDFSDIGSNFDEYEDISNAEEVIPIISHPPAAIEAAINEDETESTGTPKKRKFFKSGRANHIPKEVRILDNLKASICNGKLSLIQEEKKLKRKPKRRLSTTYDITDEQACVETILKNLNDTAYGDINVNNGEINATNVAQVKAHHHSLESIAIELDSEIDYSDFRRRLPYNTDDASVIEQQHLLLDFLINNNMCTEENFTIFIADPDNHKEEAARIVDQVFVLVNERDYYRQRIPYNTSDPEVESQQHRMLDFLINNNICTEENFDIFIANYNQRHKEADEIMTAIRNQANRIETPTNLQINAMKGQSSNIENNNDSKTCTSNLENAQLLNKINEATKPITDATTGHLPAAHEDGAEEKLFPVFCKERWKPLQQQQNRRNIPRMWNLGQGTNQYQIDAGQKNFGAHQCKQCGLVYSIHEPEEEKLHREYHASLHLLRFKGWIDEDIVAIYPEWGADGRILRITESSHSRRHERLVDVLNMVDKELGFASYIIPRTFVAYLAVRKLQIVGVCLVVPLEQANKYIRVDGVDCCTVEEFPAKCGISRIWVSPLHRRLHIASKLLHAVQQNTIFGEEIAMEKIAFSAPTESGRMFAQKVTQLENFLVYQ